jgi:hypothetical protein
MATIEQIKAKMAALRQRTSKKPKDLWRPTDNHTVRCLPYPHGDEPIQELGFHYNIGNRSVLCPQFNFGKDCVICDFAAELRQWKHNDGTDKTEPEREADWEVFKKVQCKERWYVPMFERGKEEGGAKFWSVGLTLFEKMQGFCMDEKWNDAIQGEGHDVLYSPECAFDLTVDYKKPKNEDKKGNKLNYGVTDVDMASLKPSKLHEDQEVVANLLKSVKPIFEVYPEVEPEEVEKIFNTFTSSGAPEAKVENSGTEYKTNSAEKPIEGGRTIDDAFDELAG